MHEPYRTQFEVRCSFNGFCKKALKCEASNANRDRRYRQLHEVTFSDLTPQQEEQLHAIEDAPAEPESKAFFVAGRSFTAKQLAAALHSLPEDKRNAVLLYYFFDMTDAEIAKLQNISRSTVQYRRTSSFELLKTYLEECGHDENEW